MPLTLLEYGKSNPFGETLGRPKHLAWPVNVYRVTLPKLSDDGERLNAFERVILKLIDAGGSHDAEALARETCIPKDLVQCVLLRLRDKSYIDEFSQIIKQHSDKWAKHEQSPFFVTALLFRELATGKIFPCLHILNDDNPLKKKEEEERFFQKLRWDAAYRDRPAEPRDVISALRAMQKRSMAFGSSTRLPLVQLITIAGDAELHYLDCPIAIQKSDGEFRIADPFGNGFSLLLEGSFSCLLEKDGSLGDWLMIWRRNLSNTGQNNQATTQREPYDNDANWARYPKLVANLNSHIRRDRQYRSIVQLHAGIEWALFYSCAQRPYASAVQQLRLTKQSEHPALLKKATEDISLVLPLDGLRPVRVNKLDDFLSGKAELGTVLSLSLLMAAGDASHPLRRIASTHRDFVIRLFSIKKDRDEFAHGAGKVRRTDVELPEEAFMREIVTNLLPTVRFSETPVAEANPEAVADSLLDARTSIQNEFWFALFNRLGTNLQDRLIAAERFWLSCNDGDDALVFACDVYAALQSAFRRSLSGVLPPDIEGSDYVVTAQKNANECGLGELPECLLTVRRSALRETLQGNDQTLQSCVVAFLLVSSADTLTAIAQAHLQFLADVALVVDRRGHGNEPLPLPKYEIRTLRKAAFTSIKTLLET